MSEKEQLTAIVGAENVFDAPETLEAYSRDESFVRQMKPQYVASPENAEGCIRERFDQTQNNSESVAFGIRSTAGIITGAALIMVAVFSGFAAGDLVMFQQMGFGLAVAVLLDATIIRTVLVSAAMQLLGRRNWYLPRVLQWLPDLRLRERKGR